MATEMIGGIGVGLFAVLLIAAVAFVVALVLSYMVPDAAFFIFLGCAVLPVLAFGIIMSAPYEPRNTSVDYNAPLTEKPELPRLAASIFYPNDGPEVDLSPIVDKWLPVRVTMITVVSLGVVIGLAYTLVLALTAPPYVAPQVQCLRRQLEQMHPSWYR